MTDVDQWIVRLRKAGVGEASIRNQLQTLRSALAQAVRWGWISQNPAALASHEQAKRTVRDVMTADEVHAVLAAAEVVNEMAPVAFRLAAITGARRAELAALRWTDLDGAVLTIDSAISVVLEGEGDDRETVVRDDPTKTGDRRRVALDPDTVALLEPLRAKREQYAPWLFSDDDEPPRPDRIGYWWRRSRELAGIDKEWRLHDLRHWSATFALSEGYDLAVGRRPPRPLRPVDDAPGLRPRPQPARRRAGDEPGRGAAARSGQVELTTRRRVVASRAGSAVSALGLNRRCRPTS